MKRACLATTATLLLLLLATVTRVEGQTGAPDDAPDEGEAAPGESETGVATLYRTFRLSRARAEDLTFPVVRNGKEFPNVLITLSSLLPTSNLDMYCKAMTSLQLRLRMYPSQRNYTWKSDHAHGEDYVFISKYHESLEERSITDDEGRVETYIACHVVNSGIDLAIGTLEIQSDYVSRDLVEREQNALQTIFDKCCNGEGRCRKWKEHEQRDNASPTDFCHFEGNVCTGKGNLLRLNLNEMNMSCPFPGAELRKLAFVKKLQLRNNAFKGDTPVVLEALSEMESVEMVTMSNASFRGSLYENITDPDDIVCKLAQGGTLSHFECTECNITGRLPPCLFNKESRMSRISLDDNKLSGKLPKLSFEQSRVRVIALKGNRLSGTIPKEWTVYRLLQVLDLSYNALNGSLPEGFGSTRTLQELILSNNRFTGQLPVDIVSGDSMQSMDASSNELSGMLPRNLTIGSDLVMLSLRDNRLSGALPKNFETARLLSFLDLGKNRFSGEIPEEFGLLRSLFMLRLDDNQLTGPLPLTLQRLHQLVVMDLSSNAFTGPIPEIWRRMASLEVLRLHNNQIVGDIPGWMHDASVLVDFPLRVNIANNNISGFEQTWYREQKQVGRLVDLVASSNEIEGEFPPVLAQLNRLFQLDLSANKMKGPLPSAAGSLKHVRFLNLSSNSFSGNIPGAWANSSMFTSRRITVVDLTFNQLSGRVPSFFLRPTNSRTERLFFLRGNKLECPVSGDPSYIVDLDCEGGSLNSTRPSGNGSDIATLSTLSNRNVEQNEGGPVEEKSNSSSSVLVVVLSCLVAVAFAIAMLLLAFLAKSYKKRKEEAAGATEMQPRDGRHGSSENYDTHMLQGVPSSNNL